MSIGPIDLKMAIPKTQELSKVEQNNQERLKFSLESQANEQNQIIKENLKKVNDNEKLSKSKVEEEEEKQQNKKKDNNEKQENSLESELLGHDTTEGDIGKDSTVGGQIDIKI